MAFLFKSERNACAAFGRYEYTVPYTHTHNQRGGIVYGYATGSCLLTMALCCQDLLLFLLQLCHCLCELLIIGRLSMPAGLVFHK